jgi:WD40 repeat protein
LLIGGALLLARSAFAAEEPADPADDPLPQGAKLRFGVSRPILRTGPAVALIPPGYTTFLAPTLNGGVRRYHLGTGVPLDRAGVVGPGQVVVSADGKRAAVARPAAVTVVNVASGKRLLSVEPPEGVLFTGTPGVCLSADGKVLACGARAKDGKGVVLLWDVARNALLGQVETVQTAPVFPTLSPDGKWLATHGPPAPAPSLQPVKPPPEPDPEAARTAQVWEVAGGKERFRVRVTGMGGSVVAAAFSPTGDVVAVSAGDGPIDLWNVKTGKRLRTLLGRKGQGVRLAFSPDGKTVASIGQDRRIQRWSTDGKFIGVSDVPAGLLFAQITGLVFVDNQRVRAWMTAGQLAVAWEAPTGKLLSPVLEHAAHIRSIAFADGEKTLLTSGQDGRVIRWDLASGQLSETVSLNPVRLPGQPLVGPVVHLSANGSRAFWARTEGTEVYDLASGDNLFCIPPPSSRPALQYVTSSPGGRKLITLSRQAEGQRSGSCVIWDLATRQRLAEFDIPATASVATPMAALSPDGTRLVVLTTRRNGDGRQVMTVTGFDLKTGKKLAEVEDPTASGSVNLTAADRTTAVAVSSTGRVWTVDYAAGRIGEPIEVLPVRGEAAVYGAAVFSPDGKRFAVGVAGKPFTTYGVRVYDWPRKKALHTFLGHAGPVTALRFSPDGKFLASGAQDTSVLVWDLSKLPGGK